MNKYITLKKRANQISVTRRNRQARENSIQMNVIFATVGKNPLEEME